MAERTKAGTLPVELAPGKVVVFAVVRSNRKTLGIEIGKNGPKLRLPLRSSERSAVKFVQKHANWVLSHLEKQEKLKEPEESPHRPDAPEAGQRELTPEALEALKQRARELIPDRVAYYAPKLGVRPARITIRAQHTRWGSCSKAGNLNFNCLLVLTPPEVLDSVVVHELCHMLEMNHSKRFYARVLGVFPQYKQCRKWVVDNGGRLLAMLPRN